LKIAGTLALAGFGRMTWTGTWNGTSRTFVDALGDLVDELEAVRPLSVFYYYGSAIEDGIDWANFSSISLAALVLVLLAVLAFGRRDIYT
jgi:hypothetical protein